MKRLKPLVYAIAVAAGLGYCAPSAQAQIRIGVTTNEIILTFSLTISTNSYTQGSGTNIISTMGSVKMANKDLLNLLGSKEFANESFDGDQIAVAYDWDGHVVIVDKTGTNVLFDATHNNGSPNTIAINLAQDQGPVSFNINEKPSGLQTVSYYDGGSFQLLDSTNNNSFTASGPSTIKFSEKYSPDTEFSTNPYDSWTGSTTFSAFAEGEDNAKLHGRNASISGSITGKGSGKGIFSAFILE